MIKRFLFVPLVLLSFGFIFCGPGCAAVKDEAKAAAKDAIDCTTKTAVEAISEFGPTVDEVVVNAIDSAGRLDAERVKSATKGFVTDTAKCVLASTLSRLMRPPSSDPNAPQSSPIAVDLKGLHELRISVLGDQRYKLPDGGTL